MNEGAPSVADATGCCSRHSPAHGWSWVHVEEGTPWRVIALSHDGWGTLGYGQRTGATPGWSAVGYAADDWSPSGSDGWRECDAAWFERQWASLVGPAFGDPVEALAAYVAHCQDVIRRLETHFDMCGRRAMLGASQLERGQTRLLVGLGAVCFHGAGIRVNEPTGAEVDLDWNAAGLPVGDVWRLRLFAESCGVSLAHAECEEAMEHLVERGELVRDGDRCFLIP